MARPQYRHEHGLYVFSFLVKAEALDLRDELLQRMQQLGGLEFDAPGSTKLLHCEPLFVDGRPQRPIHAEQAGDEDYPNGARFMARLIKCPLWGYPGDEEAVGAHATIIESAGA